MYPSLKFEKLRTDDLKKLIYHLSNEGIKKQ